MQLLLHFFRHMHTLYINLLIVPYKKKDRCCILLSKYDCLSSFSRRCWLLDIIPLFDIKVGLEYLKVSLITSSTSLVTPLTQFYCLFGSCAHLPNLFHNRVIQQLDIFTMMNIINISFDPYVIIHLLHVYELPNFKNIVITSLPRYFRSLETPLTFTVAHWFNAKYNEPWILVTLFFCYPCWLPFKIIVRMEPVALLLTTTTRIMIFWWKLVADKCWCCIFISR